MRTMSNEYFRKSLKRFLQTKFPDIKIYFSDGKEQDEEWIRVLIGSTGPGEFSDQSVSLYCTTKNDPEYFKLAALTDRILAEIAEGNTIPYQEPIQVDPFWETKVNMEMSSVFTSGDLDGEADIKFRVIDFLVTVINI